MFSKREARGFVVLMGGQYDPGVLFRGESAAQGGYEGAEE